MRRATVALLCAAALASGWWVVESLRTSRASGEVDAATRGAKAAAQFEQMGFPRYPGAPGGVPLPMPDRQGTDAFIQPTQPLQDVQAFYDAKLDAARWARDDRLGVRRYVWLDAPGGPRLVALSVERSGTISIRQSVRDMPSFVRDDTEWFRWAVSRRQGAGLLEPALARALGGQNGLDGWFAAQHVADFGGNGPGPAPQIAVSSKGAFCDVVVGRKLEQGGVPVTRYEDLRVFWRRKGGLLWICGLRLPSGRAVGFVGG